MIKTISYNVTGQRIETTETAMLVAGTVNVYTARFAFDEAWDGLQRTAVFASSDNSTTITREQLMTDDACTVPWEVLVDGYYLRVGVYGTKSDGTRLPTIWTARRLYINHGAGPSQEAADPSPTLVEQLMGRIGDPANLKTDDKSSLIAAINEIKETGSSGYATKDKAGTIKIGDNLKISEDGVLSVDTTDAAQQDNTKPMTSAGVYTLAGNIEVLLAAL